MKQFAARLMPWVVLCLAGAAWGGEQRPKPAFRSFCYDDWLCEFMVNPSPLEPKYLDMLVDEAAGGGADVLVINPVGMTASHPSKVWQTMWKAYAAGDREAAFGSIPKEEVPDHEAMLKEMTRFSQRGIDYLAYTFAACRRRGMATGVSIRMNDVHGLGWGRNYLVSDFWLENQHLGFRSFFNYAHPQVREHFMKLIREMIEDYDIDVLDLDFWRNPYCFPEDGKVEEHGDTMTEFIREVHRRILESKKKIALFVRIPSSVEVARKQGFDVGRWAKESLIDGVILGGYLHAAWSASVPEFREVVGDKVSVYASSDYFGDTREQLPPREMGLSADLMRGFAAGQMANGADGVYWFNFVVVREAGIKRFCDKPPHRDFTRPEFEAIGKCNTLQSLRGEPKTYVANNITQYQHDFDRPSQLPVTLKPGEEHTFDLLLAKESPSSKVDVAVVVRAEAEVSDMAIARFNDSSPDTQCVHESGPADARTILFRIPPTVMRDGPNRIAIRNGSRQVRIVAFEVRVGR